MGWRLRGPVGLKGASDQREGCGSSAGLSSSEASSATVPSKFSNPLRTVVALVASLAFSACPADPGDFGGNGNGSTKNARPSVSLAAGSGAGGDIQIDFSVADSDGDTVNVTVYFSSDGGNIFRRCTPSSGANPVENLADGGSGSFVWDSATDLPGDNEVMIRLVPNDGVQDGSAVVSDSFLISNTPTPGTGGGDEESDLGEIGGYDELGVDDNGAADISLNDGKDPARDNRNEEFLLVLINPASSGEGFELAAASSSRLASPSQAKSGATSSPATSSQARAAKLRAEQTAASQARNAQPAQSFAGRSAAHTRHTPPVAQASDFREQVRRWGALPERERQRINAAQHAQSTPPWNTPPWHPESERSAQGSGVGQTVKEFRVRADMDDSGVYANVIGTLAALGDYVAIWVDRDVPIDLDYDCSDSEIDQPDPAGRDTYGFDTCDLSAVADVFDKNIIYHLHEYFGAESDVDGSGVINVLITPVLNQLTITNDSEEDDSTLVEVYADPEVDLRDFNPNENPGSNYQEIIYLSAPDPAGFYNPLTGGGGETAVTEYVTVTMSANIAIETSKLIGYNAHVIEGEGDPEADWLSDGLGLLAADLTGFGSVVYDDVAYYLDAPHLYQLEGENSLDDVNDRGEQYLLCRYLIDALGVDVLPKIIGNASTGTENIASVLQESDAEATFDTFFQQFAIAIATAGLTNKADGSELVTSVPSFQAATTIPVNSTEYFGAEGYQQGINVRGINYARVHNADGTFDTKEIRLNGADWSAFAPGISYFGYNSGSYGTAFVRIGGLLDVESSLKLVGGTDLYGLVLRINDVDPTQPTIVIEQVFGALATDLIPMSMFEDGGESVGLGEIDSAQKMVLLSGETQTVPDTDLYLIDLSKFSQPMVDVTFSVDRSMINDTGSVLLEDVMLAVVPLGDLPNPSAMKGRYTCDDEVVNVSYPSEFLDYLFAQYVLVAKVGAESGYNPAGRVSDDPTICNFDFSREKSINSYLQNDDDEPKPITLVDQIWTYQIQSLNGRSSVAGFYPYDEDYLDSESTDIDDEPDFDLANGLGGRFSDTGEEALLHVTLPAGSSENQYVLVVGGEEAAVGPYQLSARVLPQP